MLLQHGAEPTIRNTDGRTALDLADPSAKAVLTGKSLYSCEYSGKNMKNELARKIDSFLQLMTSTRFFK